MKGGRYLYCVADTKERMSFGKIGIEDSEVYTVPFYDIAAVVHQCKAMPYDTDDGEKAREWILAHLYAIDEVSKRFGMPLPFRFNTIVKGCDDGVTAWLRREYERLKGVLGGINGKAEYGVQIFWDTDTIAEKIMENGEIMDLQRETEGKSKGVAYILQRRIEKVVKTRLVAEAERWREEFYARVSDCVDKVRLVKTKTKTKGESGELLLDLACLADNNQAEKLGRALQEIIALEGFKARFTGPWAPFNFAGVEEDEAY